MTHHSNTIVNGSIGLLASAGSVISTFQHQLEFWIRFSGSVVGLIIALIALYRMLTKP